MEFMHSLTGFADLYPFNGNMGAPRRMACACGTHPSAYTKVATAGSMHPPSHSTRPGGRLQLAWSVWSSRRRLARVAAVQIGSQVPHLMVEARQRVDQSTSMFPAKA
jgi:hypothetical protein